ncbi:MAG: hypothetical protein ABH827_03620 [bacterium]
MFFCKQFIFMFLGVYFFSVNTVCTMCPWNSVDVAEGEKSVRQISSVFMGHASSTHEQRTNQHVICKFCQRSNQTYIQYMVVTDGFQRRDSENIVARDAISELVSKALDKKINDCLTAGKTISKKLLEHIFLSVDWNIIHGDGQQDHLQEGSCASVVVVEREKVHIAWVGDVQVFCHRRLGKDIMSPKHVFKNKREQKRIHDLGYVVHEKDGIKIGEDYLKLSLTRCFVDTERKMYHGFGGVRRLSDILWENLENAYERNWEKFLISPVPEYFSIARKNVTFVVVATRVFWNYLTSKEVTEIVKRELDDLDNNEDQVGFVTRALKERVKEKHNENKKFDNMPDFYVGVILF